jgi:dephospho-CoA kinase
MIIGITGGLATGTSTAAKYLAFYLKGNIIDADKLAHILLKKKGPAYKRIISRFGEDILDKAGNIDRPRLAKKAFRSKADLEKLCSIIHPLVITSIRDQARDINKKKKKAFIIVDGPVLVESGFHRECSCLVVVTSSLTLQLERAGNLKNIKTEDALSRIKLQMPLSEKVQFADYIIDNSGGLKELRLRCRELAKRILSGG